MIYSELASKNSSNGEVTGPLQESHNGMPGFVFQRKKILVCLYLSL